MHRIRSGIAGIVLAGLLAGCSDSTVDEGPQGFTPTDIKPLEPMLKEMQENLKTKKYLQKAVPPPEKDKSKEPKK